MSWYQIIEQRFFRWHGPTWLVAVAIYGSWLTLTRIHARIPLPLAMLLGGTVIALHGSLQHETIHGRPGPRWAARLIGEPPLSLWLPYELYRDSHRRHHATKHLTDAVHDPEAPSATAVMRTALGRLLLGPAIVIARFLSSELASIRNDRRRRVSWLRHAIGVACLLVFLSLVAHMPLWKYLVSFVLPGTSLTLLRSLAEHRADPSPSRRTTVVEAGLYFRLVFLNNNFHVAHHEAPHLPWFELPAYWRARRAAVRDANPDLVFDGYLRLIGRHALRPLPEVT